MPVLHVVPLYDDKRGDSCTSLCQYRRTTLLGGTMFTCALFGWLEQHPTRRKHAARHVDCIDAERISDQAGIDP